MYGMVNEAIRKMVVEKLDSETWKGVCQNVGISDQGFESFKQYDDEMTGKLVMELSQVTNNSPEEILISFGRYWIQYASQSEYSAIMDTFASSPEELLEALDRLHTRLEMTFEDLRAPSFSVTRLDESELLVHYNSDRELPLEPFVQGLIEGIYEKFDQECNVQLKDPERGERAVFHVRRVSA